MVHGGEAVLEGVARGAGLAFGGDGSARAGAVAAGGLDLGGGAGAGFGHGVRPVGVAGAYHLSVHIPIIEWSGTINRCLIERTPLFACCIGFASQRPQLIQKFVLTPLAAITSPP